MKPCSKGKPELNDVKGCVFVLQTEVAAVVVLGP